MLLDLDDEETLALLNLLTETTEASSSAARRATRRFGFKQRLLRSNFVVAHFPATQNHVCASANLGNIGLSD
jgi:hypothetical protein